MAEPPFPPIGVAKPAGRSPARTWRAGAAAPGVLAAALVCLAGAAMAQNERTPILRGGADDPLSTERGDAAPPPARPRTVRASSRPYIDGGAATKRVEPAPLRRTSPPALTPAPEPVRRRRSPEDDPFAPVGVEFGAFRIRPAIEIEGGYDSNPNRTSGVRKGSARLSTFGEIAGVSEWSRHAASFSIRGGYTAFPGDRSANRPELDARAALRLDATRDTTFDAETRFAIGTQSPLTTSLPIATSKRPLVTTGGATLGVTRRFNRLSVGLRGSVERSVYGDAETGGGAVDLSDRNFNAYRAALRLGYELTPGLKLFVEARADTRRYDRELDASGFRRSSDGLGLRAGTTFEFSRLLTGEVSAGWEHRKFADPGLTDLRGLVGEASLVWTATPLTTVSLRAASSLDETSVAGLSGVQTRKVTLQVDHAFRRWLTGTALVSAAQSDYDTVVPKETTLSGTLRLDYKLSRTVVLRTSFTHERFTTATPGRDYTANILLVGLRLQR